MKIKRPLCTAAFIWAAVLWLLGRTGLDFFSFASPDPPIKIEKEKVVATGTVYQKDVYDSITNLYLRNSNLIIQEKKYPIENIKVTLENQKLTDSVFQGDLTAVYGSLEQIPRASNPGQFDERSYYYPRKVKWYLEGMEFQVLRKKENQVLYIQSQIRERMKEGIQKAFGEEKGGIIQAMVLGEKGELGQENKLLFQIMGTSHVLAISGMHLSVLGWGFYKLLVKMRLSVKAAGILAAAAMGFYGELTGSGAAAVRAVIMFAVSIGALLLKRTYDFLSALSLSAILLLAESPLYLYDSSFLLSFGAVLGLAAVHPVLFPPGKKKYKTNLWGKVKKELDAGIFSSISVWSILLPISMYFFYELSVWGFLVNLLILPTVGVLLISGLAGGILGLLPGLLLARAGALPGILILEFYIHIGKSVQKLPVFLWITGKPDIWQCLFYYGILAGILLIKKKGKRIFAGKLAAMTAALCLLFLRFPEGRLKVTFLDVGQGDCACIQQGKDVCYIIDGGSNTISRAGQYRILPFLKEQGIRTVDGIFVSHMDEDHVNGILEILEMIKERKTGLKVERLFLSKCKETREQREQLEEAGKKAGCEIYYIEKGSEISSGNLKITCLSPENQEMGSNEGSQALYIEMEECALLFTGDIEGEGEEDMISLCENAEKRCDILKVAHHGSKNSTPDKLLDVLQPQAAVISCGEENLYGHPHQELIERLNAREMQIYETKEQGAVSAVWDGEKIRMTFQYEKSVIE